MKKIIALSLLSSLAGCAQLMPATTPLQTPIDTINTTKATDAFVEPVIVAELDSSVKTDPLYQSIDSIAVSEQAITEPKAVINETVITEPTAEVEATDTETNQIEMTDPALEVAATADAPIVEVPQITDDNYKTVDMHGYSLQITASRDEQSLITLLSSLASQQPAWLNKKMLNGSQAYTLLVGHYTDYDQAKAALALLPQAVQQNGAFVRNFYDIEHTGSPQLKRLQ